MRRRGGESVPESLFGGAPQLPKLFADQLVWIRPTLNFVHFPLPMFEELCVQIGFNCACEVLLLAVAHHCDQDPELWAQALRLGIPGAAREKKWNSLKALQDLYNAGIRAQMLAAVKEEHEDDWETYTLASTVGSRSVAGGPAAAGLSASSSPSPPPAGAAPPTVLAVPHLPPRQLLPAPPTGPAPVVPAELPSGSACAAAMRQPFLEAEKPANSGKTSAAAGSSDGSIEKDIQDFPTVKESEKIEPFGAKGATHGAKSRWAAAAAAPAERPFQHFTHVQFREHKLKIANASSHCKFSKKAKCEVEMVMPNAFGIEWLFSVPCGDCHWEDGKEGSWIFLDTANAPEWGGPERSQWIDKKIKELGWGIVTNQANKRYICPMCGGATEIDI